MTWDDWSDKEIGFAVTTLINDVKGFMLAKDGLELYDLSPDGMSYCSVKVIDINNPADMWPIILDNDIMLSPNCADSLWKAEQGFRVKPNGFYGVATCYNKNPLRAAAIVFLMMKGAKPDERI